MPNCFMLTRKGEEKASSLMRIDEEMCMHFGAEVHPTRYYLGWYDLVGFSLAMGRDWNWMREQLKKDEIVDDPILLVIDWLEENFIADSWSQR